GHAAGGRRLLARPRAALRGHLHRRRLDRAADPGRRCARGARLRAGGARSAVCDPGHAPACPGSGPPLAGRREGPPPAHTADRSPELDGLALGAGELPAGADHLPAGAGLDGGRVRDGGRAGGDPGPDRTLPPSQNNGLAELMGVPAQYALAVDMGLQLLVGLLFLVTLGPVVRGLTVLHQSVARGLLSSRYQEQQQLLRTERSRAAGRSAESAALRRLERDLHDGPQQRLVRASMDLARVESLAGTDPEKARSVLRETRVQLGLTLDDLRRLSRGIAPPVLVDRGLPAALAELAAISPIPTTVEAPEL